MLVAMLDVESVGLHGEGFAWGVVLAVVGEEPDLQVLEECWAGCSPELCYGSQDGLVWVREHVAPEILQLGDLKSPEAVREHFWERWLQWKEMGAILAVDVPWPVEAHFLAACVAAAPAVRQYQGPYPLLDVASIVLAAGGNWPATSPRLPSEEPAHHPLKDARHSVRVLHETLRTLRALSG